MRLDEAMIVEQSHALLDGLGDQAIELYLAAERKLAAIAAPEVTWRMNSGDTGLFAALRGKTLDLLTIRHERFREFVVCISARPNGGVLHASWLLVARARLANDFRRAVRLDPNSTDRFDIAAEMTFVDLLKCSDFLALTKLAFTTAIRELTNADEERDEVATLDSMQTE